MRITETRKTRARRKRFLFQMWRREPDWVSSLILWLRKKWKHLRVSMSWSASQDRQISCWIDCLNSWLRQLWCRRNRTPCSYSYSDKVGQICTIGQTCFETPVYAATSTSATTASTCWKQSCTCSRPPALKQPAQRTSHRPHSSTASEPTKDFLSKRYHLIARSTQLHQRWVSTKGSSLIFAEIISYQAYSKQWVKACKHRVIMCKRNACSWCTRLPRVWAVGSCKRAIRAKNMRKSAQITSVMAFLVSCSRIWINSLKTPILRIWLDVWNSAPFPMMEWSSSTQEFQK